jgi:hypothetical protein
MGRLGEDGSGPQQSSLSGERSNLAGRLIADAIDVFTRVVRKSKPKGGGKSSRWLWN